MIDEILVGNLINHCKYSHYREQYFNIVIKDDVVAYAIPRDFMKTIPFYCFIEFSKYERYYENTIAIICEKDLFINDDSCIVNYKAFIKIISIINSANILFYLVKYFYSDKKMIDFYINQIVHNYTGIHLEDNFFK